MRRALSLRGGEFGQALRRSDREAGAEARDLLGQLIERVDFIPEDGQGKFQLEVHGSQPR